MSLHQLPKDSYATSNRVPSSEEIRYFRTERERRLQRLDDTTKDLAKAKEQHKNYQELYERKRQELESIASLLQISQNTIKDLEENHAVQKAGFEKLSGLFHPIKRCPEDILRNILEWTISILQHGSTYYRRYRSAWKAATHVSHVCKNWRVIALNTPYLWSFIEASQGEDLGLIRRLFNAAVNRLQSRPANIVLSLHNHQLLDFPEADDEFLATTYQNFARECAIYRFPKIDTLELKLSCSGDIISFPSFLRSNAVEELFISGYGKSAVQPHLDYYRVLEAFPTTKRLTIWGSEGISFNNEASNTTLRFLKIFNGSMSSQSINISVFTQLEELSIFMDNYASSETIALARLRKAYICGGPSIWSKLVAPNLEELHINYVEMEVSNYLSQTPSIHTLVIDLRGDLDEESIKTLASLPNLTTLKIDLQQSRNAPIIKVLSRWGQSGLTNPPFPKLMEMELSEWETGRDCSWDDLNSFVQGYYGTDSLKERVFKLRLSADHYFHEEEEDEPFAWHEMLALKQGLVSRKYWSCVTLNFQWPVQAQTPVLSA